MKKYALKNSYFKNKRQNDPDTIVEILSFYKEKGELPFEYKGNNWLYDATIERQKRRGVVWAQYLTPDGTAKRLADIACMYRPDDGLVLDACCGTGQITAQLIDSGFRVEAFDADSEMIHVCNLMYPESRIFQMDFNQSSIDHKYGLIVAYPPYESKPLKGFLDWLHQTLSFGGTAVLLLPKGFIDKKNPKALAETLSRFSCVHREDMKENFALTQITAEIVVLEQKVKSETSSISNEPVHESSETDQTIPAIEPDNEANIVENENITLEYNGSNKPSPQSEMTEVIQEIELTKIVTNPFNPRKHHSQEELEELSDSIRKHGVIQPVTVRPKGGGYEIICGERRFRASALAGFASIKAIVKQYTDDEAMEITIVENLQRKDISAIEEAAAFGQLMELRHYSIENLCKQFGKSDSYIRSRLQLRNLIETAAVMVINDELSIGNALELSKYNHDIQTDVYEEHLKEDNYSCWRDLQINSFRDKLENNYSNNLGKYAFDKTDCANCPYNTALSDLFSDGVNGKCQHIGCLKEKQEKHLIASTVNLMSQEKSIEICIRPYSDHSGAIIDKMKDLGFEIAETHPNLYPSEPEIPERGNFETEDDFNAALDEYQSDLSAYNERVEDIEKQVTEGNAVKMVDISYDMPRLCYRKVSHVGHPSKKEVNPIHKLRSQDKRNKEIAVEKTVEDVKKFLREETIPDSDFKEFEQDMLYYVMLKNLREDHKNVFGLKYEYLSDEIRADIVSKLTDDQKNLIRRDFIACHLSETAGVCKQSDLMIDFASLHFPDKIAQIKERHHDVYIKRQTRINERIAEIEGLINESKMLEAQSDNATKDEAPTDITQTDHPSEITVATLDEDSVVDQVAVQTECAVPIIAEESKDEQDTLQEGLYDEPQTGIVLYDGKISVTEFDQHVDVA